MKAILLRRPGGPEALEYVEVPTPVPGEGKVLVKADTIGVSMPEVLVRRGTYAWMPPLPAIPGTPRAPSRLSAYGPRQHGRTHTKLSAIAARTSIRCCSIFSCDRTAP